MISAVAILMLCNGIRISLKSKKYNQRNRVCHGVHDTPFLFLHFFHRISRMNRRQSCLSDYSRICADIWPLGNGSRLIYAAIVFCHADFADDADFSSWDYFCPTDFTDIHRFFMESLVNCFVRSQGVSATTEQVASAKFRE